MDHPQRIDRDEVRSELQKWLVMVRSWYQNSQSITTMLEQQENIDELALFLVRLGKEMGHMVSVEFMVKEFPQVGQLLGRVSALPLLLQDTSLYHGLLLCLLCFYTDNPVGPVQQKASSWAMSQIKSTVKSSHAEDGDELITASQENYDEARLLKFQQSITQLLVLPRRQWDAHLQSWILPHTCEAPDMLIGLARLCYSLLDTPHISPLLDSLLEILHTSTPSAKLQAFWQELTSSQIHPFSGTLDRRLGYGGQVALWLSYLPALEHDVLDLMLASVPAHITKRHFTELTQRHHLIRGCSESSCIMAAACECMKQLTLQLQNPARLYCINGWFLQLVHSLNHEACLPASLSYPCSLSGLHHHLSLLLLSPLSVEDARSRIQKLDQLLRDTCPGLSSQDTILLHQCLFTQFIDWYFLALLLSHSSSTQIVISSLHILLLYHRLSLDDSAFTVLCDMVESLQCLLAKRSLCQTDLSCAIPHDNLLTSEAHHILRKHLLIVYVIISPLQRDISLAILRQVTSSGLHRDMLENLLYMVTKLQELSFPDVTAMLKSSHLSELIKYLANPASCELGTFLYEQPISDSDKADADKRLDMLLKVYHQVCLQGDEKS